MAWKRRLLPAGILLAHTIALAYSGAVHSPTLHEAGHLPAAIAHWRYGMFELYRVNPPLPRMIGAIPMLFAEPETDWSNYGMDQTSREEIPMAVRFIRANGSRTFHLYTLARWGIIPFSLIGATVCYLWGRDLWGPRGGLVSLLLWSVDPWILGHGSLLMPDVPAAAVGAAAMYLFWKWLRTPTWRRAAAAGVVLGLAELCKTTLLLWYPIFVVATMVVIFRRAQTRRRRETRGEAESGGPEVARPTPGREGRWRMVAMLAIQFAISVYVINCGYAFNGTATPLGDFHFVSRALAGTASREALHVGNRFQGSCLERLPVPLPRDYVLGIDRQKYDFDRGIRSYFRGEWRERGFRVYHLYALAVKTPLGTLVLIGLSAAMPVWRRVTAAPLPWLAAITVLGFVSAQTGFSAHGRYILPALPFLFINAGSLMRIPGRLMRAFVAICLLWTIGSSACIYPHSLSYFNELVGGPANGHWHLLESNVAWGQDLLFLKRWSDAHPLPRRILGPNPFVQAGLTRRPAANEVAIDICHFKFDTVNQIKRLLIGADKVGKRHPGLVGAQLMSPWKSHENEHDRHLILHKHTRDPRRHGRRLSEQPSGNLLRPFHAEDGPVLDCDYCGKRTNIDVPLTQRTRLHSNAVARWRHLFPARLDKTGMGNILAVVVT